VGYADKLQPMEYEHGGSPVAGGTYPAEIFHDFMSSWIELREARRLERDLKNPDDADETAPDVPISPTDVPPAEDVAPTDPDGTGEGDTGGGDEAAPRDQAPPQNPAPEPAPTPAPAPPPTPPPGGGGGGGVSPGAAG
jgi:penicillin-binding protein 1A